MCYLLAPKVQIQGLTHARQAPYLAELKIQAVYKLFKRLEDVPKFLFSKNDSHTEYSRIGNMVKVNNQVTAPPAKLETYYDYNHDASYDVQVDWVLL